MLRHLRAVEFQAHAQERRGLLERVGRRKGLFRTEKFAFRPGLSLGYRTISFGNDAIKHMTGMGLNLSGEIAYQTSGNLSPLAELGFLTQPTGGNSDTAATYGPTFYFLRGVRL